MEDHKHCYGTMFPNVSRDENAKETIGKVFSVKTEPRGLAPSHHLIDARINDWDDCLECPEFSHCYQFSMGKLVLQSAFKDG